MDLGLTGSVALVAAASRGLGFACARELAREGCRVALFSRGREAIARAAAAIAEETGAEVLPLVADVTDPDAAARVVDQVRERWGRLDVLVNNSGGPRAGTFDDLAVEDFAAAAELLLLNAVRLTKRALPLIRAGGRGGRILTITSSSVREVVPNLMLSNAVRAAVVGWSKTLAREVASEGITVNCVAPGTIQTERIDELVAANAERQGASPERVREAMLAAQPAGRFGDPEEFAAAVAFLASARASFVSGTTLYVDGATTRTVV